MRCLGCEVDVVRRLLLVPLTLVLLAVACGSGDEAQPGATAASEREERQATVAQQQEAAVQEDAEALEAGQETQPVQQVQQQQSAVEVEQQQQIQPTQEDTEGEEQVDELPSEIVGVHKGVRSERNVLGEPDAPVEIRYFGDFT